VATDREDRWGDDEGRDRWDDDRDRRPARAEVARGRVAVPGMLLIVFGLIGVFVEVASLGLTFSNPTFVGDQLIKFVESQPPSQSRDEQLKELREKQDEMRLDTPTNVAGSVVGLVLNILMIVGGAKMRSLSGYGWALTGSIASLIPISGCLCCAMPIGLWALIVLLNADVKAAFAASREPPGFDRDRFADER
jgi:hypothetical protein